MPKELIDFLNQGWVAISTAFVFFVITIIVTVVVTLRVAQGQKPRLVYQSRAIPLIATELRQQLPQAVTVNFEGKPVERLTRTQIAVWNAGGGTLEAKAVVEELRWLFDAGGELLYAEVLAITRPANVAYVHGNSQQPWALYLNFNYLDSRDGALIEVLHTSPKHVPVATEGTIQGVSTGLEFWGTLRPTPSRGVAFILFETVFGVALAAIAVSLLISRNDQLAFITAAALVGWTGGLINTLFGYFGGRSLLGSRRSPPRRLQPE